MYEESLRTPLLVRWPGVIKPGRLNDDIVSPIDFAETFLDIAGVEVPADMQGRSLLPILKGKTPADWRKTFYYHYYEYPSVHMIPRHYGIRTQRHKLMHFYQFGEEWELYDLKKDPDELQNLYGKEEQAKVTTRLKKQLKALQKHYQDDSDISEKPKDWQQKVRPSKG